MNGYLPRVVDSVLEVYLRSAGGILIEGPRACGKTATARRFAASEALLDSDPVMRTYLDVDPSRVLKGESPRLIDEWQVQPLIWNLVRREIDDRQRKGQFILTGSAMPPDDITRHTGAGRILRMRMRPMSLFESKHSTGEVSLASLLKGDHAYGNGSGLTFDDLVERLAIGGWPAQIYNSAADALPTLRGYIEEITHAYLQTVDGRPRNPDRVRRVMNSLARNVATEAKLSTIAADIAEDDAPIKTHTVEEYLAGLAQLMVIEDQTAWAPRLRSRSRIRSTPKRHFVDPSLAVACLGKDVNGLLREPEWTEQLFESLVVRDLRVYSQKIDGKVFHYRDNTGLEVDAITETASGTWAAFEVKLGTLSIDDAASTLRTFADRIDISSCGSPASLAVITATGPSYRRPDGVDVISVGCLGP